MQEKARTIVENTRFQIFIMAIIVINAAILGIQTLNLPDSLEDTLEFLDNICLAIYIVEAVLKIIAYRTKYFRDPWNVFDFVIILLALIPQWLLPMPTEVARILRVFRTVKAFRLVSAFRSMRVIVDAVVKSIPGVISTAILMFVIAYIYAVIGTVAFADVAPDDFGDLAKTLFTLFQVMTLEGWPDVCRPIMEEIPLTSMYFVTFIIIAAFIMINVVVGIVVGTIDDCRTALDVEIAKEKFKHNPEQHAIEDELHELKKHLAELELLIERSKSPGDNQ